MMNMILMALIYITHIKILMNKYDPNGFDINTSFDKK